MGADLWDPVIQLREGEFRCLAPSFPSAPTRLLCARRRPDHRRMLGIVPIARLDLVEGSRTWVMRDRPEQTADLIGRFAWQTKVSWASWPEPTASVQGGQQHE